MEYKSKYNANANNIYDMLDITYDASRQVVYNRYKEFINDVKVYGEDRKKIGDEFVKYFSVLDDNEYKKQMESSYGKKFDNETKESINMVNEHSEKVILNEALDNFDPKKNNLYDNAGNYVVVRHSVNGKANNVKKIVNNNENSKSIKVKKGTIVVVSVLLMAATGLGVGTNIVSNKMSDHYNNVIAEYTVQLGDTIKGENGLDNTFYKYDKIYDDFDVENMSEEEKRNAINKASSTNNVLLEGDKLIVITNEKTVEEKGDTIRILGPNEIEKLYDSGKLFWTKKDIENWMNGNSNYMTADSNLLKK